MREHQLYGAIVSGDWLPRRLNMVKKLAVAATFAASMLVGVPTANASPFLCMQKFDEEFAACEGNSRCELGAEAAIVHCMQQNNASIDPEE